MTTAMTENPIKSILQKAGNYVEPAEEAKKKAEREAAIRDTIRRTFSVYNPFGVNVPPDGNSRTDTKRELLETKLSDMFQARRDSLEQQRTDDIKMAKYNALGNVLTTLVQPIGWAIGGKGTGVTGGVQPYDNRQYLESFNRAVKAADDLRNLGAMEEEYQFDLAKRDYETAKAWEEFEKKENLEAKNLMERIQARTAAKAVENEKKAKDALDRIRLRYQLSSKNKPAPKDAQTKFEEMVLKEWLAAMSEYDKNVMGGIIGATPPEDFEDYYNKRAKQAGYQLKETGKSVGW